MQIPNTDKWLPRTDAIETLKDIFYKRCLNIEALIVARSKHEKQLNIDNFDSGLGLEDIVREEFSKILPERYFITKGIINDRNGYTAGDQDLIIFNKFWFPFLKTGAISESRRFHFPIEGVYAVGEIKQTLTYETLDDAMRKLVICQRLERPKTEGSRIVENRRLDDCVHTHTNPLYTFILATNLDKQITTDEIFQRFFDINKSLKQHEIIRSLCILQDTTFLWSYFNEDLNEWKPARFIGKDLYSSILPIKFSTNETIKTSLYFLMIDLLANLYNAILGGEDLALAYGNYYDSIQRPPIEKFLLKL